MKHLISASTFAFGLICIGGVSAAQDQTQAPELRGVTVTAVPGQYETYVADLDTGYSLQALVGHTHRQYMRAWRSADRSESARKRGIPVPGLAVAIDNSSGAGVARQFRVIDAARNTVAIVDVYCKRTMPSGGPRCTVASRPMRSGNAGPQLAATQAGVRIAEVSLRD